ncbi:MAG: thymidine phosphorylase [Mycoplasmoidaceae bacterium]|nr:thymidine phosphorylase [Mycoplasmoidaceae bacterium]
MNFLDIIEAKRTKKELNQEQIQFFIDFYVNNKIPDYQSAAFLMAINLNDLNLEETYYLTKSMLYSGNTVDLSTVKGIKIDKHSTGGVGDKVSVIIGPICAAFGLKVAKMSGKGLGHTGGTIDKLNSIGVNTDLSLNQCRQLLNKNGIFITAQTEDIVPADKKIYDLRNATSTVDSIPLIASSIASKKIAMGTDYVFIDVKVGDGGYCETIEKATKLSKILVYLLKKFNRKCIVHITNMNQPLGRAIGNMIEIKSSIEFLHGNYESDDIKELIYEFVSDILVFTKICKNKQVALKEVDSVIKSGKALDKFYE